MQAGRQAGIVRCVYRTVPSVFLIDWHARTHARMHASIVAEQFDRQPIEVGSVFGFAPKQFEGVESFCFERHRFALDGPDAPSKGGGEFKLVVVDIVVLLVSVGVVLAIDQKQSGTAGIQDPTVGVPERYLVDSGKRNVDPEGNASIGSTSTSTTSGTFALPRRKHRMVVLVTVTVTDYAYTAAAATAAVVLEDPVLFRVEGIFSVQRQRQRQRRSVELPKKPLAAPGFSTGWIRHGERLVEGRRDARWMGRAEPIPQFRVHAPALVAVVAGRRRRRR